MDTINTIDTLYTLYTIDTTDVHWFDDADPFAHARRLQTKPGRTQHDNTRRGTYQNYKLRLIFYTI